MKTDIIAKIDQRRLWWFGHAKEMGNKKLPKILLNWKPTGKSKGCRPKKQSKDNLAENLNKYRLRPTDPANRDA